MDFDALSDDVPHRHSGIERRKGILKDCHYICRIESNGIAAPSVDEHRFGKGTTMLIQTLFRNFLIRYTSICNSPGILQFHQKHEKNPF